MKENKWQKYDSPCVYFFGSQQFLTDLKCPDLIQKLAIVIANLHPLNDSVAHLSELSKFTRKKKGKNKL